MKKTFLSRRNALLSPRLAPAGFLVLAVALLLLLLRLAFPSALLAISAPFFHFSNSVDASSGSFFAGFRSSAALASERDALAKQNETLVAQNTILSAKLADLEKGVGEATLASGTIAPVLARPPESPYDSLVVAGSSSIKSGDLAYTLGGIPLGRVTSASLSAARITLYSAPGSAINAWAGTAHTPLTLLGAGAGAFTATLPRTASTSVDESVLVAGALPIGVIARVAGDPSSPEQTLYIQGLVNPFALDWVLIRPLQ